MIEFKPVTGTERDQLLAALRQNATDGAALRLSPRDTSFIPGVQDDTEDVIALIRSVPCHYAGSDDYLYHAALELLRGNETYTADATRFAPIGNSVVGSLLALTHQAPRQYTERAVVLALATLRREVAHG